jgi:hypothetical protein
MMRRLVAPAAPAHALAVRPHLEATALPGLSVAALVKVLPDLGRTLVTAGVWHWRFHGRLHVAAVNGVLHYAWRA